MNEKNQYVRGIFLNTHNEVLVQIRNGHGKPEGTKCELQLPGGSVKEGESSKAAMIRAINEKLGVKLENGNLQHYITLHDDATNAENVFYVIDKSTMPMWVSGKPQEPEKYDKIGVIPLNKVAEFASSQEATIPAVTFLLLDQLISETSRKAPKMSAFTETTSGVVIVAADKRSTEDHRTTAQQYRQTYEKTDNTSLIFEMAQSFADYFVRESVPASMGNNTGYFDPLAAAIFTDVHGTPLTTGASISLNVVKDNEILRRLYAIVVKPGCNVILHDRYNIAGNAGSDLTVVKTTSRGAGNFMRVFNIMVSTNVWANCFADRLRMADLFGFEIDKNGVVYVPSSVRPEPTFSHLL